MPKTWAASRRRAISSREYGRTDDSTAMPAPRQSASGVHSADPPVTIPTGATSTAAMVIAMARPSSWANRAPVRRLKTMYAAHDAPAASASPSPVRSTSAQGVLTIPEIRTTPTAAPATASRSLRRWDNTVARTRGPMNSMVTTTPIGIRASEPASRPAHRRTGPRRRRPGPATAQGRADSLREPRAALEPWHPSGRDEAVPACRGQGFLDDHRSGLGSVQHAAGAGDDADVMRPLALMSEEVQVAGTGVGCRDVLARVVLVVGVRGKTTPSRRRQRCTSPEQSSAQSHIPPQR